MKNQVTRRNHILPMFYLKGFCRSHSPGKIWVYVKQDAHPYETVLKNACVEKDYYNNVSGVGAVDDSIETILANQKENPANPILDKLRNKSYRISSDERQKFASYITSMIYRTPRHEEAVKRFLPGSVERLKMEFEQIKDYKFKQELHNCLDNLTLDRIKEIRLATLKGGLTHERILPYIVAMKWLFLETSDDCHFLTSDNPIFLNKKGLRDTGGFLFPISSKLTLYAVPYDGSEDEQRVILKDQVEQVNRRLVNNASKQVFCSCFDPKVRRWMQKHRLKVEPINL